MASEQQQRILEQQLWDAADALRGNKVPGERAHAGAQHFSHAGNVGVGAKLMRTLQKFETYVEAWV